MGYDELLLHTVTIFNPVTDPDETDIYGNPLTELDAGIEEPARIQQLTTDEELKDRDTRITGYRAFLRADSVITALSTVSWNGDLYRVNGDPAVVDGFGEPHHVEAQLERVMG